MSYLQTPREVASSESLGDLTGGFELELVECNGRRRGTGLSSSLVEVALDAARPERLGR